jgi:hypothetical protein
MSQNEEINYGKLNKRIVFTDNDHRHAQLLIKLRSDSMTQADFFRSIVGAYISGDQDIQNFIDRIKKQSLKRKEKSKRLRQAGAQKVKDFGLNEGEIENIFDIIEEESPDL